MDAESPPTIRFCRIDPKAGADIPLPRYMTPQAAGMDLHAAVTQDLIVEPGDDSPDSNRIDDGHSQWL